MPPFNIISSGSSVRKRLKGTFVDLHNYCESSSISLEGGHSKDRVRLYRFYTFFSCIPHLPPFSILNILISLVTFKINLSHSGHV